MFEPIEKILDLKKFKEEIFKGKIFVFQKSQFTLDLIQEIKTEISIDSNVNADVINIDADVDVEAEAEPDADADSADDGGGYDEYTHEY